MVQKNKLIITRLSGRKIEMPVIFISFLNVKTHNHICFIILSRIFIRILFSPFRDDRIVLGLLEG